MQCGRQLLSSMAKEPRTEQGVWLGKIRSLIHNSFRDRGIKLLRLGTEFVVNEDVYIGVFWVSFQLCIVVVQYMEEDLRIWALHFRSIIFMLQVLTIYTLMLLFVYRLYLVAIFTESAFVGFYCSPERDYYEILGVPQNASRDEIKKAFHAVSLQSGTLS